MNRLITAQITDNLLRILIDEIPLGHIVRIDDIKLLQQRSGLAFNELKALLEEFESDGLLYGLNVRQNALFLGINPKAHKLIEAGGFSGELSMLKKQLELLNAELNNISDKKNEKTISLIASILSIINSISNGLFSKY